MARFTTTNGRTSQTEAKATLANVTIVMAGIPPLAPAQSALTRNPSPGHPGAPVQRVGGSWRGETSEQPRATASEVGSSTSGRLDVARETATPPTVPAAQGAFPPIPRQVANFLQSAVTFVGDGCALVDDAEYRRRLDVCRACDRRAGKRCTACGCWIGLKARGRAFTCPLGRWQ